MKRTFVFTDDKSNKFWTIEVEGTKVTVIYGKAGTASQVQTKQFADEHNYSIIDKTGKVVGKIDNCISATPFENGISTVQVPAKEYGETAKYGIIDKTGKPLSGFRYENVYAFIEGVAWVTCPDDFEKYAFIDIHGTEFWVKDNNLAEKQANAEKKYKAHKTPVPPAGTVLDDNTFPKYTELIANKTAEKYYQLTKHISYPFMDFASTEAETNEYDDEYQEIRIFKGDLHVSGIQSAMKRDWNLFSLIVDGNLIVDGDIDWAEGNNGSFIYVTGNVTAQNVILEGNPQVVILGNLEAENGIMGYYGDDGGQLYVDGETKAPIVVEMYYFIMNFGKPKEGTYIDCDNEEEAAQMLLPKFYKDESFDSRAIANALRNGENILRK
ncbi:MAG: WG repeat-containing protein [Tannerella sp.]|nr:WG repeat-containing protein [Tannerella sp.]